MDGDIGAATVDSDIQASAASVARIGVGSVDSAGLSSVVMEVTATVDTVGPGTAAMADSVATADTVDTATPGTEWVGRTGSRPYVFPQ